MNRIIKSLLLLTILASPTFVSAEITRYYQHEWESRIGYVNATAVDNILYVSGIIGKGKTMEEQVSSAYKRIKETLSLYGLGPDAVFKEVLYTADMEATKAHSGARKAFYGGLFPTATWVEIERLYAKNALIEIEVTAAIPKNHVLPNPKTTKDFIKQ